MHPMRFRWFILFLLFAISIVNSIDRAAISYSIAKIERDLDLSPADAGGILRAFGLGVLKAVDARQRAYGSMRAAEFSCHSPCFSPVVYRGSAFCAHASNKMLDSA
jgi:hypothetical protein